MGESLLSKIGRTESSGVKGLAKTLEKRLGLTDKNYANAVKDEQGRRNQMQASDNQYARLTASAPVVANKYKQAAARKLGQAQKDF